MRFRPGGLVFGMAFFERDGARIHYEVHGQGFPVLLIAPGGMYSEFNKWNLMAWNPLATLVASLASLSCCWQSLPCSGQ